MSDPVEWLTGQLAADKAALLCNGDTHYPVTFDASILKPRYVPLAAHFVEMWIRMPCIPEVTTHLLELMCRLGPASSAYWGDATPISAGAAIVERFIGDEPMKPLPGAPGIGILAHVTHPAIPALIGWVNYWSAETCRLVGFSHTGPQSWAFRHVIPCEGGGVVLQLTEAPLDLEHPEHLAALEVAYDAFPVIHRANGS